MIFRRILCGYSKPVVKWWVAEAGGCVWRITCDDATGYTARYRELPNGTWKPVTGRYDAFPFAEGACRIKLRELQNASEKVESSV